MTRAALAPALALLGALACATLQRGEGLEPSAVPASLRAEHELFARRCSRCHSVSVPLLAHVTDPRHWVRYVERMRRQPNSGISLEESPAIVRFLTWYTESQRAPDAAAPPAADATVATSVAAIPAAAVTAAPDAAAPGATP